MKPLRAAARLAALAAVTTFFYLGLLAALPFLPLLGVPAGLFKSRMCRRWAGAASAILGIRIVAQGPKPEGAFLLVANHLSYVDVLVLASLLDCAFVAKDEVARWPVVGRLALAVDTVFIARERRGDVVRVARRIEETLASGRGVVLFPEGTSSEGSSVLPFKPSLLQTAVGMDLPVSYASLTYATRPGSASAREAVCWWGDMRFLDHARDLFALPGFTARVVFGEKRIFEPDRKVLAERLWRAVRRQFEPVTS
jgi:1-acyl-sn-glycerol-3-phosphate acyltransferase